MEPSNRIVAGAAALAALAAVLIACQTRPPRARTALELTVEALETAGVKAFEEGRYETALRLFTESEDLARSTDDLPAAANALNNQGATLEQAGRTEEAVNAFERALRIHEALGSAGGRAICLANLASLELDRPAPSLARAQQFNRQAESLFAESDDGLGILQVRNTEGRILLAQGRTEAAGTAFAKALADADGAEAARMRAVLLANLGRVAEESGDLESALKRHQEALALDRSLEVFTGVARDLEAIARVQIRRGEKAEGARSLLRALDVVVLRIRWEPWAETLLARAEALLKELGRAGEAVELRKTVTAELERARKEEERLRRARMDQPLGDLD